MMYLIVILIGALLLMYFGGRWLMHETREIGAVLRKFIKQATGGQTEETLIRQTHATFAEQGLPPPDLVAVPRDAETVYAALRREAIDRVPDPALPAALGIVLAISVDRATVYLRAVYAAPGEAGIDRVAFWDFDQVAQIHAVTVSPHPALASPAESAVELQMHPANSPTYHVRVDPGWGVSAEDLAGHVTAMIRDRRKAEGGTVILR